MTAKEHRTDLVATGLIAMDIIVEDGDPDKEPLLRAGGSCGNVAANIAWLGNSVLPWARLDGSKRASLVRRDLEAMGVDGRLLSPQLGGSTPLVLQVNFNPGAPNARHVFRWRCPKCQSRFPDFRNPTISDIERVHGTTSTPRVYYFDRAFPAAIRLAEEYKRKGALVIFEPNSISDVRAAQRAVTASHIVKYSTQRIRAISDAIDESGPQALIETSGEEGLQYRTSSRRWTQLKAVPAERVIDAAGSGDWVTTGIIHEFLRTRSRPGMEISDAILEEGLRLGQAFATLNCSFPGARGLSDHLEPKHALGKAKLTLRKNRPAGLSESRVPLNGTAPVCISCDWTIRAADRTVPQLSKR